MESSMRYRNEKEQNPRPRVTAARAHDPHQAALSYAIDVVADRQWFDDHPGVSKRQRPASPREVAAYGLPKDTAVVVSLRPSGNQAREFLGAGEP
jgi:hypothetical protein